MWAPSLSVNQLSASRCATSLCQLPQFLQAENVSVYLSMSKSELQTQLIIEKAFELGRIAEVRFLIVGKNVFVPFIDGPIMHMFKTPSLADIKTFPMNRWGIPEPSSLEGRGNGFELSEACWKVGLEGKGLDLIVVPGVAFDRDMNRLGHGKGYYDHFIQRCHTLAQQLDRKPPALGKSFGMNVSWRLVALSLKDQFIETGKIPMTATDWKMDGVIVNGEVFERSQR